MIRGLGLDTGIKPKEKKKGGVLVAIKFKEGTKGKMNIENAKDIENKIKEVFGEREFIFSIAPYTKENEKKLFNWYMT